MTAKKEEFSDFSPDELSTMYREDPDRFNELAEEAKRKACAAKNPDKSLRLQQMQWSIDMQLRKGKTPLSRMHIMEGIFYSRVYGANGQLGKLMESCKSLVRTISGTDRLPDRKEEMGKIRKV